MTELSRIQRAVGDILIPEARAAQSTILPQEESMPLALELFYTACAMKPSYRPAGMLVARRFAERMGLDGEDVQAFAIARVTACIEED